jgi:hypothetical protein
MSIAHLSVEEIDCVLAGEGLAPERAAHLAGCVACRRRHDELLAAFGAARLPDPDAVARARVRAAALAAAVRPQRPRLRWWLAAAAALALVVLAAVFVLPALRTRPVDTDAVLRQVDEVLDRDPLAAMTDEGVVNVVVADGSSAVEVPAS